MNRNLSLACIWLMVTGWTALSPARLAGAETAKFTLPSYTKEKLDNGITLLLLERHQLPLVSFVWIMKSGGSICDPESQEGLASLTAQLLRKGTKNRSAVKISQELDFVGASLQASATHDYSSGSAEFVSKDVDLAVSLLADLLMHPVFPDDEVKKLIQQEVDGIAEAKEVPNQVLASYFRGLLFGTHPYGRPVSGTETTLPKINREAVARFHREHYVPGQLLLAVVGDFNTGEVQRKLGSALGEWQARPARVPALRKPAPGSGTRALVVEKPDATQTFFRVGSVGLARTSPDWLPLQVVNTLFGGRFTSMINTTLRIESGLTYGARSGFSSNPVAGEFYIGSFTKNETTGQALEMTLDTLKRLREKGISPEQLQSAKSYIKGQFGPTMETNDQLASAIAELEFYGLGPDYYNTYFERVDAVTLDDARRLIERYYPVENLSIVLIGQAAIVDPVAAKLSAQVRKKSITDPGF
jgi:zinc protease